MTTSMIANARARNSLIFPNAIKRLANKPGSARVRAVKPSLSHYGLRIASRTTTHGSLVACSYTAALYCDQTSGRIAQTKFAGERNLDLNQECLCTVVMKERASMSALCQKRTHALQQFRPLLDHLVGESEQRLRDTEAKCFCGLDVDHQLEFCRLHYG